MCDEHREIQTFQTEDSTYYILLLISSFPNPQSPSFILAIFLLCFGENLNLKKIHVRKL